jgi:hypothetical protein
MVTVPCLLTVAAGVFAPVIWELRVEAVAEGSVQGVRVLQSLAQIVEGPRCPRDARSSQRSGGGVRRNSG